MQKYNSFHEFYPFYLSQHANRTSRRLHFVGSALILLIVVLVIFNVLNTSWLLSLPLCGYGFAWIGHFFYEKNKPATFKHPIYSLIGDWVMFKDILIGKIPF